LRHMQVVLADSGTWWGTLWTVWIALASTTLATVFAMGTAVALRAERGVDRFARLAAVMPLAVPHVVAALGAVLVLSQSGLLARLAFAANLQTSPSDMPVLTQDRYGIGLILALTWKELPFLALIAFSVIARRGPALEETARSLGAGALRTFRAATLPVLWRGLLPSSIAVFTFVAGNYEVAALLAPSSPLALPLLTMDARQGVDLLDLLRPQRTLPVHYDDYGVFKSPLSDFRAEVERRTPPTDVRYLQRGETYEWEPAV